MSEKPVTPRGPYIPPDEYPQTNQPALAGAPQREADPTLDLSPGPCEFCGLEHWGHCPRLAEIQYYPNGTRRMVRFHPPPAPPKKEKDEKA